jgi:hypothetical protein
VTAMKRATLPAITPTHGAHLAASVRGVACAPPLR